MLTENEKYMLPEVYYSIFNSLKINYLNYAWEKKIDEYDLSTEFGQKYRMIIDAKKSVISCDIEKEQAYYKNLIDDAKKYLVSIGGRYIG